MGKTILLDDGSGGKASHRLINELFVKYFSNPYLDKLDDAALLDIKGPVVMSTDGYTVDPIFFPGGNIGSLAVHGTVNDVSMMGGKPKYIACAFIVEEGFSFAELEKIVKSMAEAAKEACVLIVTGDTKVVPKGAADKIFITTTGIGELIKDYSPSGSSAKAGDLVLISGSMGDHGIAVMAQREGLSLGSSVLSDSASLNIMVASLMDEIYPIHTLRDPTRGGLATTLNEIAQQSGLAILIEESKIPVKDEVSEACAVLGLDPLYLANEGKIICILPAELAEKTLELMRRFPQGKDACIIGRVLEPAENKAKAGQVLIETPLGGHRLLGMLEGEQLPRIC